MPEAKGLCKGVNSVLFCNVSGIMPEVKGLCKEGNYVFSVI